MHLHLPEIKKFNSQELENTTLEAGQIFGLTVAAIVLGHVKPRGTEGDESAGDTPGDGRSVSLVMMNLKVFPMMLMWVMMSKMTYTPTMQRQVQSAQVNTLGPVLVLQTSSVSTPVLQ